MAVGIRAPFDGVQAASPGEHPQAPVIDGPGNASLRISTRSALAQRFIDQGIVLAWGLDHTGAARSFAETARLDPQRALCEWGQAQAQGPNVNHPQRTHLDVATAQHAVGGEIALVRRQHDAAIKSL